MGASPVHSDVLRIGEDVTNDSASPWATKFCRYAAAIEILSNCVNRMTPFPQKPINVSDHVNFRGGTWHQNYPICGETLAISEFQKAFRITIQILQMRLFQFDRSVPPIDAYYSSRTPKEFCLSPECTGNSSSCSRVC